MAGSGEADDRSLEETSTWAVAVVCLMLVIISIIIEHAIHLIGKWLKKRHKRRLHDVLEKIKSELMLLGFISLLLTVGQGRISKICVPKSVGNSWHPCDPKDEATTMSNEEDESEDFQGTTGRRLLHTESFTNFRRILAGGETDKCAAKNKAAFISSDAIQQLQIFIFVLAVFHVLYCISTMALGRLKMRRWKSWELETKTAEYEFSHDPNRFRFARDTSFGHRHLDFWSKSPILIWIVCFFRQFLRSVPKVDYLTLRHGFIMAHLAPQSSTNFNFQKYIKRALEEDFKIVVGISPTIWFLAVLFLLLNTHGWHSYRWLPFIPLIIILLVGTKLQMIITRMATRIMERGEVVKGTPVVQPTDDLFWFNRPVLLLHLIHFVLFQNAFQLAFFAWSWDEFGYPSCFHKHMADTIIRISMGILIQILCGYVTLPLYALVTQMGSNMKPAIFNDRVATGLRKWHHRSRKNLKVNRRSGSATPWPTSGPATSTHGLSPVHLLQHYRSEIDSLQASPKPYTIDHEQFDLTESQSSSHHTVNGSCFRHREQGLVHGGTEMQELGDSTEQQSPHDIDSDHGAGISIDFSFDKRQMMIE